MNPRWGNSVTYLCQFEMNVEDRNKEILHIVLYIDLLTDVSYVIVITRDNDSQLSNDDAMTVH